MENCMLLEEIVFNILLWLPVVSLLRFRSVCKAWCAIIDSSYFINQHLLHPNDNSSNGSLIFRERNYRNLTNFFLLSGQQFEELVSLDLSAHLPLHKYQIFNDIEDTSWLPLSVVDSCNGIICLSCQRPLGTLRVALWNPATKHLACLPQPPHLFGENVYESLGFGYAVKANDYKVVRATQFISSVPYIQFKIYSLQTDCWRNVDIDLLAGACFAPHKQTYWNGHYCWLICLPEGYSPPAKYSILSFDLSNEVFQTIKFPDVLSTKICERLTTMSDKLACIDSLLPLDSIESNDGHFDIWVLTKYGVKESWTKLYMIRLSRTISFLKVEGFSKNGNFLLLHIKNESKWQLGLCDPKTQQIKNIPLQFTYVAVYKESLVPVKRKGLLTSEQE